MNELMKRWKAQKTKGHKVNKIEVPIKKGSSIILKSITPDADNLIHDRG
ncbi:hypothetical protein JZU61_01760, partial [bacterium]|nr:hypothetical protein [bacterium]